MTAPIRVGFFRESSQGDPADPSLATAVRPRRAPDQKRLVGYLQTAPVVRASFGADVDALDRHHPRLGGMAVHSDGTYEWPSDLAHYVARYNVALPSDFVDHCRSRGFRPPRSLDTALA